MHICQGSSGNGNQENTAWEEEHQRAGRRDTTHRRLTLRTKRNMLSFQDTLLCRFVPDFGTKTVDPQERNRVAHPHDGWDRTHVLLEAQVLESAGEEGDHGLEFGLRDGEGEVVERHGERCPWMLE